ncbi:FtsX-like permease family protein [Falsiporphyromonas endometrii]|uniref:FtsX-like permease family protein n=1 Tax=Falsiporphyromonas endometrii TaxID=1387297 RepID=A0ABV9K638_9PORP
MNLPFSFALRYFFSRKSLNAVNVVSAISAVSIAVVAFALIIVLSIYNGYEKIILDQTSDLDPDLSVERIDGKPLKTDLALKSTISSIPEIVAFTPILKENALIKCGQDQVTAQLIGVGSSFDHVASLKNSVWQGSFNLKEELHGDTVYSYNVGSKLLASLPEAAKVSSEIDVYIPKRVGLINPILPASAFSSGSGHIASIILTGQPNYDANMIIPIEQMRDLMQYDDDIAGSLALKIKSGTDIEQVKKKLLKLLNSSKDEYKVLNRLEQHPDISYIVSLEKWMTFLILIFVLLLALFNVVSSLSMLMIEKKPDISILRALGMPDKMISRIFLTEGTMVSSIGTIIGLLIGLAVVITQENYSWLGNPNAPIPEYPMLFNYWDLIISFAVVILMGILAAYYPVNLFVRKNK